MTEQLPWNRHASLAWRTEWHRAGYRRILADPDSYHKYMRELSAECLALSDAELRRRLWP